MNKKSAGGFQWKSEIVTSTDRMEQKEKKEEKEKEEKKKLFSGMR